MVISAEVQINAIPNFTTCFLFQNILPLASHFNNGVSKFFTACFLYWKCTFVESDKFSSTFSPLMKFLKILEKKGHRQKEEEPEDDIEKEVVPSLLMAHALAEALCENK